MTTIPTLTDKHLEYLGACDRQRAKFRRLFPDGLCLTQANVIRATQAGLNARWLIGELSDSDYDLINKQCRKEYVEFWKTDPGTRAGKLALIVYQTRSALAGLEYIRRFVTKLNREMNP